MTTTWTNDKEANVMISTYNEAIISYSSSIDIYNAGSVAVWTNDTEPS